MKPQITIPDEVVADVEEYFRLISTTLEDRIQREVDRLVSNAVERMEERRRVAKVCKKIRQLKREVLHES